MIALFTILILFLVNIIVEIIKDNKRFPAYDLESKKLFNSFLLPGLQIDFVVEEYEERPTEISKYS